MEMEMRVRGNNAEKELAEIGVDEKRKAGAFGETASENRSQDCVPLATVEMLGKDGHLNGEGRGGTQGLFSTFNIFQYGENVIGELVLENHWRHTQDAGNADFRTKEISL